MAPNFTMNRMLIDYETRYYKKLGVRSGAIEKSDFALAKEIYAWKEFMLKHWGKIEINSFKHPDISGDSISLGESYETEVTLKLGDLPPSYVGVELVIPDYNSENGDQGLTYSKEFELVQDNDESATYRVEVQPDRSGEFKYGIRIYARHPDLPHRQDFALVKWA